MADQDRYTMAEKSCKNVFCILSKASDELQQHFISMIKSIEESENCAEDKHVHDEVRKTSEAANLINGLLLRYSGERKQ